MGNAASILVKSETKPAPHLMPLHDSMTQISSLQL